MAGDWIKWTKGLTKKREVLDIAESLNMEAAQVAGHLMEFWEWLDDNAVAAPDGNAYVTPGVTGLKRIDRLVHVTGFGEALSDVGWVKLENGSVIIPNFARHNGQTSKTRALTNNRVNAHRNANGNAFVTHQSLPEKRREVKSSNTPLPPRGFGDFWASYPRKEGKGAAERAWKKISSPAEILPLVLAAIEKQKRGEQWRRDGGQFIPHPATWLNQKRWLDEGTTTIFDKPKGPAPVWAATAKEIVQTIVKYENVTGRELDDVKLLLKPLIAHVKEGKETASNWLKSNLSPWGIALVAELWNSSVKQEAS